MSFCHHQPVARARGGGAQAGVLELERGRAVHPAHERRDEPAVAGGDAVGVGAVDDLRGHALLEAVQRLVHVHHEAVHGVDAVLAAGGDRADLLPRDLVVVPAPRDRREVLPARVECRAVARRLQRSEHGVHLGVQARAQPFDAGHEVAAFAHPRRRRGHLVEARRRESRGLPLRARSGAALPGWSAWPCATCRTVNRYLARSLAASASFSSAGSLRPSSPSASTMRDFSMHWPSAVCPARACVANVNPS